MPGAGTAVHVGEPSQRPTNRGKGRRSRTVVLRPVALGLVVGVLTFMLGYWVHAATHPSKAVTVDKVFTGRIIHLNLSADAGCIQPDDGGTPVCTTMYVDPAEPRLQDGQHVHAAYEHIAGLYDLLVVYNPNLD